MSQSVEGMALFTTIKDPKLEEAKRNVVAEDRVCPECQAPFTTSTETLAAVNPDLGMVMHRCPACGAELWSVSLPR